MKKFIAKFSAICLLSALCVALAACDLVPVDSSKETIDVRGKTFVFDSVYATGDVGNAKESIIKSFTENYKNTYITFKTDGTFIANTQDPSYLTYGSYNFNGTTPL